MVRFLSSRRFLAVYSGCLTVIFAVTMLCGFSGSLRNGSFDSINVRRINVIEPDGTIRMVLSDKADFPGDFIHNKEIARPDRQDSSGLMFYNDEGTEDGGLIYGGKHDAGATSSFSHLSFDQYDQDQTVDLGASLQDGQRASGLSIEDVPDFPITPEYVKEGNRFKMMPHGPARAAAYAELNRKYLPSRERGFFGRERDASVGLTLRDTQGRVRAVLKVKADGEPVLQFLDGAGKVMKEITATEGQSGR